MTGSDLRLGREQKGWTQEKITLPVKQRVFNLGKISTNHKWAIFSAPDNCLTEKEILVAGGRLELPTLGL